MGLLSVSSAYIDTNIGNNNLLGFMSIHKVSTLHTYVYTRFLYSDIGIQGSRNFEHLKKITASSVWQF